MPKRDSLISTPGGVLPPWARWHGDELRVELHVQPGARRSALIGEHGGRLKLAVHAPPIEGRANAELLRFLAELLNAPKGALRLIAGASGRRKSVGVRADAARALLDLFAGPGR